MDGVFHTVCWIAVLLGLGLLYSRALHNRRAVWASRVLWGWILVGWGLFNLVEGVLDHHILGIHHVYAGPHQAWWDAGFLALGALFLVGGHLLQRGGQPFDPDAPAGTARPGAVPDGRHTRRRPRRHPPRVPRRLRQRRRGCSTRHPPCWSSRSSSPRPGATCSPYAALVAATPCRAGAVGGRRRSWAGWRCWPSHLLPPLGPAAHHDFRGHMAQHMLIGMYAPLALVLAAPVTLALRTLPPAGARRVTTLLHGRPRAPAHPPAAALALSTGTLGCCTSPRCTTRR